MAFYVPGPAYVFPAVGPGGTYQFLGFTERGLTVSDAPRHEDVPADYAGASPAAVSFLGQEMRISGDFVNYDEDVSQACASFLGGDAEAGAGASFSIGTLIGVEANAGYPLLVYCPYSSKPEFNGMVPVYNFFMSFLSDNHEVMLSTRRKAPRMTWRAIPVFGTGVGAAFQANKPPFDTYYVYNTSLPSGVTLAGLTSLMNAFAQN